MMSRPSYQLFDKDSTSFIFGMQTAAIQRMLDFDTACRREKPSVSAIINPGRSGSHKTFFGTSEILLPIYPTVADACADFPETDVMINFASYRSAYPTTLEATQQEQLRTMVIIAEGVPERRARHLRHLAVDRGLNIVGPATVGGIKAGAFRIANTGGTIENIINSKLHRPGSVGFVSKSGGMSNETYNILARMTDGVNEGIAIGGDAFPCSTLLDHLLRYEANPDQRVELLKKYAAENFPQTPYLDFALSVEQVTTRKKDTLILNVDGAIGILCIDMMYACGFDEERVQGVVDGGGLNGLFVLGRTIGMIGHYMDQKRLGSGLYRHPWDDVLYMLPKAEG
jgi:succinyl-CoA synthetase alpha subunit